MIHVTFINIIIIVWAADIRDSVIERKINATLVTKNISESALLVDLQTFVSYNGLRKAASNKPPGNGKDYRKYWPVYYHPVEKDMKNVIMDLMRQTVYSTQERLQALEPILKRHENHPSLRMSFIYNRLRQLIIDMRRLYTLQTVKVKNYYNPVYQYIFWYSHVVRKYFDVLYIVEHVIELFDVYSAAFKDM